MSNELQHEGFLRISKVLEVFPVSKSTWWAGIKKGKFPKGVKLTENTTAWRVSDIQELLARTDEMQEENAKQEFYK